MSGRPRLRNFDRLKLTLTIAMLAFLTDILITNWMLQRGDKFYESNPLLYPEIGLPLMVLNYIIADHFIPHNVFFDNIFYSLSLTQWSSPIENLLVLLNITHGINLFIALPFILITIFIALRLRSNRDDRLTLSSMRER